METKSVELLDIGNMGQAFLGLPVNRITRGLWETLCAYLPGHAAEGAAAMSDLIHDKLMAARPVDPEPGEPVQEWILPPNIRLVKNDFHGWTMMLPEKP